MTIGIFAFDFFFSQSSITICIFNQSSTSSLNFHVQVLLCPSSKIASLLFGSHSITSHLAASASASFPVPSLTRTPPLSRTLSSCLADTPRRPASASPQTANSYRKGRGFSPRFPHIMHMFFNTFRIFLGSTFP